MKKEIISELDRLQRDHEIKILYAVESGSRSWGFASTDSDWDVRFLYIHRPEWYFRIDDEKDSLEEILPNDLDLAGWEFKKALRLFRKSNPPLLEWLRSPIVYLEQGIAAKMLRDLESAYFSPRSAMHHYLHMGENNYQAYLRKERVRVKKYFYVLRPILACEWIKEKGTFPPMEFQKLIQAQLRDTSVLKEVNELLERKISGEELNEEPANAVLNTYLEERIYYFNDYVKGISKTTSPDSEKLNQTFLEVLKDSWKDQH